MTTLAAATRAVTSPSRPSVAGAGRPAVRAGGAAVLVAAGYLDPGNWASDIAAGQDHAMRLGWVLVVAVVAAFVLQRLAARVGAVTGADLCRLLQTHLPRWAFRTVRPLLVAAVALTDVAEVFGVVLGVRMVTGWSAGVAAAAAGVLVVAAVALPARGGRALVYATVAGVTVVYAVVALRTGSLATAADVRPHALDLAAGPAALALIGSILMPHNLLLHTALGRDAGPRARGGSRMLALSLFAALAINLIAMALAARMPSGGAVSVLTAVGPVLFGVTLVLCGLASSVTTGMVGSDVTRDLLPGRWGRPLPRRLLGLLPAVAALASPLPGMLVLAWSQTALALCLPAALVPLVWLAGRPDVMGAQRPGRWSLGIARTLVAGVSLAGLAVVVLPS